MFDQEKEMKTWIFPNRHKLVVWRKNVTQSEADILVRTMEVRNEIKNHNIGVVQHANGQKTIEGNVFLPVYTCDKRSAERKLKAALTSVLKVAERENEESVAFPLKEVKSWPIEQIQRSLIASCAEYFMAANEDNIICIDDEDLFPKYLQSLGTFLQEFDTEAFIRTKETLQIFLEKGSLNERQETDVDAAVTSNGSKPETALDVDDFFEKGHHKLVVPFSEDEIESLHFFQEEMDDLTHNVECYKLKNHAIEIICKRKFEKDISEKIQRLKQRIRSDVQSDEIILDTKTEIESGAEACKKVEKQVKGSDLIILRIGNTIKTKALVYEVLNNAKSIILIAIGRRKLTGKGRHQRKIDHDTESKNMQDSRYVGNINGITVFAYRSRIVDVEVEGIVSAANESLMNTLGVAKMIAKAAGKEEFNNLCDENVKKKGKLQIGECRVTPVGKLEQFKYVLHVVGPRNSFNRDKRQTELDQLAMAIINCLLTADGKGLKSIALPCISTGTFGFPIDICSEQYYRAIVQFSTLKSSLLEVHFVDIEETKVERIRSVFSNMIATKHGAVGTTQDSTTHRILDSSGEYDEVSKSTQDSSLIESASQGLESESIPFHRSLKNNTPTDANMPLGNTLISSPTKVPYVFSVHDTKVKIIIVAGNITRANVDAIVCTESGEFSGRGAIARQIMSMAGELYKSQYKDQQRGKHELTSVTAMEADGQLMCHYVLHAVSPHWTHHYTQHNQDFSRHIRLTVHNILTKASELKIQSVAIPFLGTSDDEHARPTPVPTCCDVIVEAILHFFTFPRTSNTAENSIMEVQMLSTVQGVVNGWKGEMEKQLETLRKGHVRNYSPKEDRELNRYVEIENIPAGTTVDKLKSLLFVRGFPIAPPQLVFTDGMVKAIAICQGENDAVKLSCFTGNHIFKFKHLKEQSLGIFTQKLDAKLLKVVYKKKQYKRLVDELLAIEVNLADGSIETKTSIQLQCAEAIVASCGERLGVYTHKETHSEFELLAHNETVSGVSVLIWDVVKTVKAKEINKIKSRDGSVEMDSKTSCITINLLSTSGDDMAHATVVKSFAESIKCNDIVEIEVDAKDAADAPKWCKDIQEKLNYTGSFCIYTPDDKKVVVCCESYDDILKITHQFLIKQGKVKTTARGGRRHREVNSEPSTSDNRSSQQQSSDICSGKHSDFDWEREASLIKKYQTAEGIVVCVYKASIVKLPVDCIVNAANATLQHGGGVAKVIADAAGHILTIEGDDYRRRYGNIQVGQVCSTTAGRLPYACVIHTVGPRWYDYTPHTLVEVKRCEEDLYSAIYECFMEAEKKHLTSIALPPVSAAKLGVPEEFCVYHYAKATLDYSKRSSASSRLNEIHFIDINQNIIRNIQDAFEDMLHGKSDYDVQTFVKQQPYRRHNSPSQRYNYNENSDRYGRNKNMQGSQAVGGSNSASNYATNQGDEQNWPPTSGISQFAITPDSQDNEKYIVRFRSSEEPTLVLWKTNILSVQASVVVSVEDTKGTGRGKVAELIAKGLSRITVSQYSSEKKRVFSHNTKIGDVLVTKGYESGYGHIFHVVLAAAVVGSIMIKDRIKILGSTYDKILRLADDNENIKSLVMPLVGTGCETKDDVKASADAFIDSYRVFCNRKWQKSNTRPLTVNLVFREQTNLSLVLSILEKQISDSQLPPVKVPPRPSQPPQHYRPKMTDESIGACAKTNCVVCSNSLSDPIVLDCGHVFCRDCITQQFKLRKICPTCGKVLTGEESRRSMAGLDIVGTVKLEKSTVLDVDAHSSDGVQLMADSDFAGSIKLENTTVSNVDSNSSDDDDDDDVSLDNFELILKCVDKDGGCSMKILKAEIGFEALKWRYVFQNQDKRTKFEQKIKAFSATLVCKGELPVVIETNKVLKISTLSKNIKQFIQSETSGLHVEEAIVDADEIKRVIGIMSFTSSALTNQSVLWFIQHPQGQTKVWFVGVGKDVLEVLNLFKQTQKYLSNIAPSGAT